MGKNDGKQEEPRIAEQSSNELSRISGNTELHAPGNGHRISPEGNPIFSIGKTERVAQGARTSAGANILEKRTLQVNKNEVENVSDVLEDNGFIIKNEIK